MYKRFLLKCSILNHYKRCWQDGEFYFDTKEDMIHFIKNGSEYTKPDDIRVEAAFELNKIDLDLE